MTKQTQIQSWEEIKEELGQRQTEVYATIKLNPLTTVHEIAETLQKPVHSISGRLTELQKRGLIDNPSKKHNKTTNRMVSAWRIK